MTFLVLAIIWAFLNFRTAKKSGVECVVGGCNGEICQGTNDESIASICLWNEKFACYKTAKCEVQKNGACGWTMDQSLTNCLSQYSN